MQISASTSSLSSSTARSSLKQIQFKGLSPSYQRANLAANAKHPSWLALLVSGLIGLGCGASTKARTPESPTMDAGIDTPDVYTNRSDRGVDIPDTGTDAASTDTSDVTDAPSINHSSDAQITTDRPDAGPRVRIAATIRCEGSSQYFGERFIPNNRSLPIEILVGCFPTITEGYPLSEMVDNTLATVVAPNSEGNCSDPRLTAGQYIVDYTMRNRPSQAACADLTRYSVGNTPLLDTMHSMPTTGVEILTSSGNCPQTDATDHEVVEYSPNSSGLASVLRTSFCLPPGTGPVPEVVPNPEDCVAPTIRAWHRHTENSALTPERVSLMCLNPDESSPTAQAFGLRNR